METNCIFYLADVLLSRMFSVQWVVLFIVGCCSLAFAASEFLLRVILFVGASINAFSLFVLINFYVHLVIAHRHGAWRRYVIMSPTFFAASAVVTFCCERGQKRDSERWFCYSVYILRCSFASHTQTRLYPLIRGRRKMKI